MRIRTARIVEIVLARTRSLISRHRNASLIGLLGLLGLVSVSAHADFSGPYALNPPDAGVYDLLAGPSQGMPFGGWTGHANAGFLRVDTSLLPGTLVLNTLGAQRPVGGFFLTQAAAAGTVNFDYTIAGQGTGSFGWFNSRSVAYESTPLVTVTDLNPGTYPGEFSVEAGDYFGFSVSATGVFLGAAQRIVTIENFSAPVPEPSAVSLMTCAVALLAWRFRRRNR
jgi:hypothetical protein